MNFNSLEFLIFLPIVIALFWLLPKRARPYMLLAASYFFYMSWNATLVFLILTTTAVSYFAGLIISKTANRSARKFWLILTMIICFGILFFFKYFNFMSNSAYSLFALFGVEAEPFLVNVLLPVGISFYTFQTMSYVFDVYRGTFKAENNFFIYALFVSFFPQLVAGPIERPGDLLPQLKESRTFQMSYFSDGFRIMLSGFFRKCVVADFCGIFVNNVFSNLEGANSLSIFIAGLLFTAQIYNDFAGYSEIAMGAAKMIGVDLTVNFNRPFLSTSYSEFFRRWHITLNRWFTDYLYIPLGGNRKGLARKILNMFIVFGLCGLWHGANWTYVLWGLYAAFFMCLENLLKKPFAALCKKLKINLENEFVIVLRRLFMLVLFTGASLIFRSQSVEEIGEIFSILFTKAGTLSETVVFLGIDSLSAARLIFTLAVSTLLYRFTAPKVEETNALPLQEKSIYAERVSAYIYFVLIIAVSWIGLLAVGDVSSFVYFQF